MTKLYFRWIFPVWPKLLFMVKQSQYFRMAGKQPKMHAIWLYDPIQLWRTKYNEWEIFKLLQSDRSALLIWSKFILCGLCMPVKFIELFGFWFVGEEKNIAEIHERMKSVSIVFLKVFSCDDECSWANLQSSKH